MQNFCVYLHTVPTGKVYVGMTGKNPLARWNGGYGYLGQPYFWNAIVKYGWDNIKHEIVRDNLTEEEATELEKILIEQYDSANPAKGYNISRGGYRGNTGLKKKQEAKDKISEANRVRWAKMDELQRQEAAERCRHMHEGKRHSKQSRAQCMMNNPRRKVVIQMSISGEKIAEYNSIREAERRNGIKHPSVQYCIEGKQKTAGGYIWKCL